MKWDEARSIYPNQFVKFEVLKSTIKDGKEFIEEIAIIGPVSDDEATKELLNSPSNVLVYHTSKREIIVEIRTRSVLRKIPS